MRVKANATTNIHGCAVALALIGAVAALPTSAAYQFDGEWLGTAQALPAWSTTLDRQQAEQPTIERCLADEATCTAGTRGLRYVLSKAADLDRERQVRLVNRYINQRRYRVDRARNVPSAAQGTITARSHWMTLLEFLRRGGDCEDFATAKYFMLRQLGVPADELRVLITYDRRARDHHAVLAYRHTSNVTWLLESDNTIKKGSHRGYRFEFAVNENGIWDHAEKSETDHQL
jgi:predicted transglutaminase-like cysteine proteinase